jgi:chromosome segregation ATPase
MSEPTVEQLLKRLERRRNVMDRQEVSLTAKAKRIDKLRAQVEELEKKLEHEKKVNEGLKNETGVARQERDRILRDTANIRDERNRLYSWIAFAGHLDHYHRMEQGWRQIHFDYTKFLKENDIDIA